MFAERNLNLASCTGIDPVPTPWKGVDLASNLAGYKIGAPRQNRTAVSWLQNRRNAIIRVGQNWYWVRESNPSYKRERLVS